MLRAIPTAVAVALFVASALPSAAQDETFPAMIVAGDCESTSVVAELTDLVLPTSAPVGAGSGRTAASSFTTIPVSFEQLTSTDHAVQAAESCGAIGGSINATGALIVVLSGTNGDSGIAYLGPSTADPGQTDVSLFVAAPDSDQGASEAGIDGARSAIQSSVEENAEAADNEVTPPTDDQSEPPEGSDADRGYIGYFREAAQTMTDSSERMSPLFDNPRFGADDWTIAVATELGIWRAVYTEAQGVVAPPRFAEVHATFLESLRLMDSASSDYATGFDTFDPALIEQGTEKVRQATTLMQEVIRMLEEIQQELGL